MILWMTSIAVAAELSLQIDSRELVMGQTVPINLQVLNGRATGVPPIPVGDGLMVQYQGLSQQHVVVNFESTRISQYSYQLSAIRPGDWEVGPINLMVDGQALTAGPVTIHVGDPPKDQGGKPVVATVSDETPFLGQVVVYRFQFQHDKPVMNARWTRPEFAGFIEETTSEANQREYQMVQDGVPYTVQAIDVPLVAAGAGERVIPPAALTAQFRTQARRRRTRSIDDLFGDSPFAPRGSSESRTFATDPLNITVSPLPKAGQPADFKGLVGRFKVRAKANTQRIKLGESITVEITVMGDGTLAGFRLPSAAEGAEYRIYDDEPEIVGKVTDGRFRSRAMVRRAIVPEVEGEIIIPGIRVPTFDPERGEYVAVQTDPMKIVVLPGEEGAGVVSSFAATGTDRRQQVQSLGEDILPVVADSGIRNRTVKAALPVLVSIPVLPGIVWMILGLVGWSRGRTVDERAQLRTRLSTLPNGTAERLQALESIFRDAAGLRLGVPAPALERAMVADLGEDVSRLYSDLEHVRYGGGDAEDLEVRVRRFVEGT